MAEAPEAATAATEGRITDEDIARLREQIGIPQYSPVKPWNMVATRDSMSHFAFGMVGDDNPLWHDPDYGAATRWRGQIAHPYYITTLGRRETPRYTPEQKALFKGVFRKVGKYQTGTDWTFYRPVTEGERIWSEYFTHAVEVKESEFAGGRSVYDTYREPYFDAAGTPVALQDIHYVNAERKGSGSSGRYKDVARASYTPDQLAEIDALYAAEERRGAVPRYWEEVEVGEELPRLAKGPLTMVDILGRHAATGIAQLYAHGPLRYGWAARQKMPAFFQADEHGVPQVAQRVHWDDAYARELGLPTSYDYGAMRSAWKMHLVTNWMGDDGWLWRFRSEMRKFSFMGDYHVVSGEVTAKRIEDGHAVVDLDLRCTNQRGEVTAPGTATVILPSREHGPVVLPVPPADLRRRGAAAMAAHAQRARGA